MIWRKWKFWVAVLIAATLVGLLEAAQVYLGLLESPQVYAGTDVSWTRALISTLPSWYLLVALLPLVIWVGTRFPLEKARWPVSLPVNLLAAAVFALVHAGGALWLSEYVLVPGTAPQWDFASLLSRLLTLYFVLELVTYFALIGGLHAYTFAHRYEERERMASQLALKTSRLEASLVRANLDTLRMQLNPHFLFNTLNAISVLAMKGERQNVVRMLTLLSDLLRATLEQQQQVMPLRDDLALLDRYLQIEQVRFRDRLTVEQDICADVLDAEVPSLLLQPLVENAIRHGVSRMPGAGWVRIEARAAGGRLELRVLDSGPGFGGGAPGGTGLGLTNTRARLEQLYGADRVQLELGSGPAGGAAVTVRLPLRRMGTDPAGVVMDGATRNQNEREMAR